MHEAVFSADRNSGAKSLDKAAGGGRVRDPLYSFCRTAIAVRVSRRLRTAPKLLRCRGCRSGNVSEDLSSRGLGRNQRRPGISCAYGLANRREQAAAQAKRETKCGA